MGKRLQAIKRKLRIPSWQALVHLVVVELLLNILWNWVSKMFQIVVVREIGFLVIFVAAICAVSWYLPKLAPTLYSFGIKTAKPTTIPPKLEHDGLMWEEARSWNSYYAKGPLCPKDSTPLAVTRGNRMDTEIKDDFLIQIDGSTRLICPECNVIYTLGINDKRIGESRREATSRFEGMRRRENRE
jgi:uncharacterized protein YbaR (Trm112 family)